jgi:hypothetical protein
MPSGNHSGSLSRKYDEGDFDYALWMSFGDDTGLRVASERAIGQIGNRTDHLRSIARDRKEAIIVY